MATAVEILAWLLSAGLSVPLAVLTIELLTAWLPRRSAERASSIRPTCTILIPAHNEESGIAATLANVQPHLLIGDRLVVVADNCTDRTAEIARAAGAEVIERQDPSRRGKGYALDFGVRAIADNPPAVVVVIDADCRVLEGAIDRLVVLAAAKNRPVQAAYIFDPAQESRPSQRMTAFAIRIKNAIRPRGLNRIGLPCLLTGSGMAFPWKIISEAKLATSDIVEDMGLGAELAIAGYPPIFAEDAVIKGELPATQGATQSQRRRWEHGHIKTLLCMTPRLIWNATTRGRPSLFALALELAVPPLALLVLIEILGLAFLWVLSAAGSSIGPVILLGATLALTGFSVLLAWLRWGRDVLPLRDFLVAPFYVMAKIPLYFGFLARPQGEWVRTDRGPETS